MKASVLVCEHSAANEMAAVHFVLSLLAVVLLLKPRSSIAAVRSSGSHGVIGAIVDRSSRIGKEEIVAMEIAREDVYRHFNQNLTLHVKDADQRNPIRAALAGTFV